jgi:hypothetical protein
MTWILQTLIDHDMTVAAHCRRSACNHSQLLDLAKLRDRFGPDVPAMHDDLVPRLRCAKCGGKEVGLTLSPRSNEKRRPKDPKPNLYESAKGA